MPATKNTKPFTEPLPGMFRQSAEGQLRYGLQLKREAEADVRKGICLTADALDANGGRNPWTNGAISALMSFCEEVGFLRALLKHDDTLREAAGLPAREWAKGEDD